jgi:SAM-dependent methyltransferase
VGYRSVDDDPDPPVLIETMDDTSRWEATVALRAWERRHLALRPGERLLDVGCGPGDAALALASDVAPAGEVVGVDRSEAMVAVARHRTSPSSLGGGVAVRFVVGDAMALDQPDASFDAVRCERTLQWVADPQVAVDELARVLRPGGRLSLIDTDWSTFRLDVGDPDLEARVVEAMRIERTRPAQVGRHLGALVAAAGLAPMAETTATQRWTSWDPDADPVPLGCFSMASLAADLADTGHLDPDDVDRVVATIHEAARAGRFAMALTMFAVVAARRRP